MLGNIVFNYGAQIFLALAGIVTLPFLLARMGPELYAFVGISFTIQTVFSALDGGLSGAIAREFAVKRSNGGASLSPYMLLKKIEPVYFGLAIFGVTVTAIAASTVAEQWLKTSTVTARDAQLYLILIAAAASVRLAGGLYRSVLVGYELQKKLSCINIASTSIKYYLVLIVLDILPGNGSVYFYFQLAACAVELAILALFAKRAVSHSINSNDSSKNFSTEVKSIFYRSIQIWALTLIWIASNQLDKIVLSGNLKLSEYGYFSVVATLAAGILMLGSPITSAAMPRIALLYNDGSYEECKRVYLRVSELLAVISLPFALTLVAGAQHCMFVMTRDASAALTFAPILKGYALGSWLLLLAGLTFLLQYAGGSLTRNLRLNIFYLIVLTPSMLLAIHWYSAFGAAMAWLGVNLFWTAAAVRVLNRLPSMRLHKAWLNATLVKPLVVCIPSFIIISTLPTPIESAFKSILILIAYFTAFAAPLAAGLYSRRKQLIKG